MSERWWTNLEVAKDGRVFTTMWQHRRYACMVKVAKKLENVVTGILTNYTGEILPDVDANVVTGILTNYTGEILPDVDANVVTGKLVDYRIEILPDVDANVVTGKLVDYIEGA